MKRFDSPDSVGGLISIYPQKENPEEENYSESNKGYSKEFQAMLDSLEQEDCSEEFVGKKRRLSSEQVKALERYFEVENKLEPERKAKLADELGLQPRQVAIWFQNRRARWKTKQLEKDYGLLKANYSSLKLSYEDLQQQNEALIKKVRQLKEKTCRGESQESSESVKEESPISKNNDALDQRKETDSFREDNNSDHQEAIKSGLESYGDQDNNLKFSLGLNGPSSLSCSSSSSSNSMMTNWFQLADSSSRAFPVKMCQTHEQLGNHLSPFGSEEPHCNNFFSVDQAPTLYWYFPEQ